MEDVESSVSVTFFDHARNVNLTSSFFQNVNLLFYDVGRLPLTLTDHLYVYVVLCIMVSSATISLE